ncbi:hypothetical protein CASFOL_042815 [Castilleja foliolosa]|uniref:Uncharacterized protein n=1 Tax=Castilleja foliolosa TaxID=1961234 RepID=A0ABD3B7M0_9LAMI
MELEFIRAEIEAKEAEGVAATVKTEMMMVSLKHLLLRSFIYDSSSDSLSKKVGVSETTNHVAATTREIGAPIVPGVAKILRI